MVPVSFVHTQGRTPKGISTSSKNFSSPTTKNVMTGILLSPGPVSTVRVVQSLSGVFMSSVNKSKFLLAANRLEAASLGSVVILKSVSSKCHVFVKKTPAEMSQLLQLKENEHLCTAEEFQYRFELPTPAVVSQKIQRELVQMGLVAAEYFKEKPKRAPRVKVPLNPT